MFWNFEFSSSRRLAIGLLVRTSVSIFPSFCLRFAKLSERARAPSYHALSPAAAAMPCLFTKILFKLKMVKIQQKSYLYIYADSHGSDRHYFREPQNRRLKCEIRQWIRICHLTAKRGRQDLLELNWSWADVILWKELEVYQPPICKPNDKDNWMLNFRRFWAIVTSEKPMRSFEKNVNFRIWN